MLGQGLFKKKKEPVIASEPSGYTNNYSMPGHWGRMCLLVSLKWHSFENWQILDGVPVLYYSHFLCYLS